MQGYLWFLESLKVELEAEPSAIKLISCGTIFHSTSWSQTPSLCLRVDWKLSGTNVHHVTVCWLINGATSKKSRLVSPGISKVPKVPWYEQSLTADGCHIFRSGWNIISCIMYWTHLPPNVKSPWVHILAWSLQLQGCPSSLRTTAEHWLVTVCRIMN